MQCILCGNEISGIGCYCTKCSDKKCVTVSYCREHYSECVKSLDCRCKFASR